METNEQLLLELRLTELLVLIKKGDLDKAIEFSQTCFKEFVDKEKYSNLIDSYLLFFAYDEFDKCPNKHLLSKKRLIELSSKVNKYLNKGNCKNKKKLF